MSGRVIGREAEVSAVHAFIDAIGEGYAVLVLEGDPGIGKTTVWHEGVRHAEERGDQVLACRAAQAEARLSFVGLARPRRPKLPTRRRR